MKIKTTSIATKAKTTWSSLIAGWQSQIDQAKLEQERHPKEVDTHSVDGKNFTPAELQAPAPRDTRIRGFLKGHRRPGSYPRFTPRLGQTSRIGRMSAARPSSGRGACSSLSFRT